MGTQQEKWSIHEAVVLLEAYLTALNKHEDPQEYVPKVSEDLRAMAKNQGKNIDETFRNVAGITFQIRSMESAYRGYTVFKPATKLFSDVVALYQNDAQSYEKLLEEARNMINNKRSLKEEFLAFLATQVSPAQLSAFYDCYNEIEEFVRKIKIIDRPIFEVTDVATVEKVQRTIEQNKLFVVTRRKRHGMIVNAGRFYLNYVRDMAARAKENSVQAGELVAAISSQPEEASKEMRATTETVHPVLETAEIQVEPAAMAEEDFEATQEEAKTKSAEELIRDFLKEESQNNQFGTTVPYIHANLGIPSYAIKKILTEASWAVFQYGKYYYAQPVDNAEIPDTEPKETPTVVETVQTEQDNRLAQKYPVIFKRVFYALQELTEQNPNGTTVAALHGHIGRIARCADIEDILDNASWAKGNGAWYCFSTDEMPHKTQDDVEEEDKIRVVDFAAVSDLKYMAPISYSYFGEEKFGFTTWKDLYVSLVGVVYDDYPHKFEVGMSFSLRKGRLELGTERDKSLMFAPRPLPNTEFFIETNISATDMVPKIRYILDLCDIDYENVVIKYTSKEQPKQREVSVLQKTVETSRTESVTEDKQVMIAFYRYLQKDCGLSETSCRGYVSAGRTAERFAKEHGYRSCILYTRDRAKARATVEELFGDQRFLALNTEQHNRFLASLRKLIVFLKIEDMEISSTGVVGKTTAKPCQRYRNESYETILREHFVRGFRIGSVIDRRKFRKYYLEEFEIELAATDEKLDQEIKQLCVMHDEKAYFPETMLSAEVKEELLSYIKGVFSSGTKAIYYQALFTHFSEKFLDHHIYNAEMLKAYLEFVNDGSYHIGRSQLSVDEDISSDPVEELRACLIECAVPMAYDALYASLPHIPQDKIRWLLGTNKEFVWNKPGEFFHIQTVNVSEEEVEDIASIIAVRIEQSRYITGNELYAAVKTMYPYTIENNQQISVVGFRGAMAYYLSDRYSFKGNIISALDDELTMEQVFAEFCLSRQSFTMDELTVLKHELGSEIYLDTIYANALRVSRTQFVSRDQAQFRIEETDAVIDALCQGRYMPIAKVENYAALPDAGFPWNEYLLEHYVAQFSRRYQLLDNGFNATQCSGAIVKRDSGLTSFGDLIVDVLANSQINLKKEDALAFLCEEGYISRRKYSEIDQLLIRAMAERNARGAK